MLPLPSSLNVACCVLRALEYIFSCASALGALFISLGKRFVSIPTTFLFSCQSRFTSYLLLQIKHSCIRVEASVRSGQRLKKPEAGYAALLFLQSVTEAHSLVRQIFEEYLLWIAEIRCLAEDGLDIILPAIFFAVSVTVSQLIQSLDSLLLCHLICGLLPNVQPTWCNDSGTQSNYMC